MDQDTLRRRIRELRMARGWSISKLARIAGVSQSNLSEIENGHTLKPTAEFVLKVAVALGTSTDYLLGATDDPRPRQPHAEETGQTVAAAYHPPGMPPWLPPEAEPEFQILLGYLASKYRRKPGAGRTEDKKGGTNEQGG